MTIKREDIDSRQVDFSNVATGRRLPTVHPGEILRDEFLKPIWALASTNSPTPSRYRAHGPTTLYLGAVRLRRTQHYA
jgi:hypothetical protein